VFGARLPLAERYAELLADAGVVRGLIGPREAPRLWERHLLNCAVLADAIPADADVCDIGTGAGLPGLVLAIRRPDLAVTLVEPLLRRVTFLSEVVDELGIGSVTIVRARAEELHGQVDFSVVTSRAVAPLGRLLDWSMPLVREGGAMVAMKGSSADEEIGSAQEDLRRHGASGAEALVLGAGQIDPPTTAVRVEAGRRSRLGWGTTEQAGRRSAPGRPTAGRPARKRGGRR
jgi:16S rRNA (guanine527-N7)-methyltransferase